MGNQSLFTTGYEGLDLEDFLALLNEHEIDCLIDIREKPISRKKGFSKTRLEDALSSEGIIYMPCKELGSPSAIRKKVKEDGDYQTFFEAYADHLSYQRPKLNEILELIGSATCCLLCFEKDHEICHRKIVAEEIKGMRQNGMVLNHL